MIQKLKWLMSFCLMVSQPTCACLILFLTDGTHVLVANHEDWVATDAELTFIPSTKGKLGMVIVDFASERWAQGGFNTAGLYFDGTATPFAPYVQKNKENCHCYLWQKILEECKSVEEALVYVRRFQAPELEKIHVLLADHAGHSAVVGVYDGKLQLHRRLGNHQILTNFNLSDPTYGGEEPCRRFETAQTMLLHDSTASVLNLTNILSKTHQNELTVYSTITDLKEGIMYVYPQRNFQQARVFHLQNELKQGKHRVQLKP